MRLLNKLSIKQKNKYKRINRIFSLELGRALSKRVIWQVSVPNIRENLHSSVVNGGLCSLFLRNKGNTHSLNQNFQGIQNHSKISSWSIFRSAFFGKMWLLNNASAVPGVVWPTKRKKLLIAKMKAFKAFSLSTGGANTKFLVKNLQKIYAQSFSVAYISSLWKMASAFDCLQNSFFLKTGFFGTFPAGTNILRSNKFLLNGFENTKTKTFVYPGDYSFFPEKTSFFAQLFSVGPESSKKPVYSTKPFLWLCSSFYKPATTFLNKKKS